MREYKVGYYVREGLFQKIINNSGGDLLVYCSKTATKNNFNKFNGSWNLYVYFYETQSWHPLVKSKTVIDSIILREFITSDGLINSILGYNYPMACLSKYKGSACEITKEGNINYYEKCIFV